MVGDPIDVDLETEAVSIEAQRRVHVGDGNPDVRQAVDLGGSSGRHRNPRVMVMAARRKVIVSSVQCPFGGAAMLVRSTPASATIRVAS
jgi:hypothetical protein